MSDASKKIPVRYLPWMVGLGMFAIFLLTLSTWVALRSVNIIAQLSGWDWRPVQIAPLSFLLTRPILILPPTWQMLGLNVFAAACGAACLGLLVRSIQLLPHDRTREQRHLERGPGALLSIPLAWLPAVAAAVLCGLQMTFWEHATALTGEMVDLLVFAYVIRCFLEFRVSQKESWLNKMAFVYGLGVTNNWALIGFFPLFLIALGWLRGLKFFEFNFFVRMVLFGLAGLLLYLLLPAINAARGEQGFVEALMANLRWQKTLVFMLPFQPNVRLTLFLISLSSMVPLVLIAIRWPSFYGDISPSGNFLSNLGFRVLFAAFLLIGVAVFFDPQFSGRTFGSRVAFQVPYLTFYYLSALVVGYLGGYILLIFGRESVMEWERPKGIFRLIRRIIVVIAAAALILLPLDLARKNLPRIRAANGEALSRLTQLLRENLPETGAVVLSDPTSGPGGVALVHLLRASYQREGRINKHVLIDTDAFQFRAYQKHLARRHPEIAGDLLTGDKVPELIYSLRLIDELDRLQKRWPIYYLHPSFGYYFEHFYPRPHGLVYELKAYPPDATTLVPPPLTDAEIALNHEYWKKVLASGAIPSAAVSATTKDLRMIGGFYSRALNYFGVQLQRQNLLSEAGRKFSEALEANPENASAEINHTFNVRLREGKPVALSQDILRKFELYRLWDATFITLAMKSDGPFDDLDFTLRLGELFGQGGNVRQSAQLFLRVLSIVPAQINARIALVKTYIDLQMPDPALQLIAETRRLEAKPEPAELLELLRAESIAYLRKNDFEKARQILLDAQAANPRDEKYWWLLGQFYEMTAVTALQAGDKSLAKERLQSAVDSLNRLLALAKDDFGALMELGALEIQRQHYDQALAPLNRALQLQPRHLGAQLDRAIANLQLKNLDAARRDYETLEKLLPEKSYQVYYGLGEIAVQQKKRSVAIKNYKLYLKYGPAGTDEYKQIKARLGDLKGGRLL